MSATIWTAKHVADVPVKSWPVIQPAPRHKANRTLDRLGANSPDVRELMEAAFVGNPFQGRAR